MCIRDRNIEVPVRFYHRISLKEKALFYEHLSNLVDGGVTLIEALRSFVDKTVNPRFFRDSSELLLLIAVSYTHLTLPTSDLV